MSTFIATHGTAPLNVAATNRPVVSAPVPMRAMAVKPAQANTLAAVKAATDKNQTIRDAQKLAADAHSKAVADNLALSAQKRADANAVRQAQLNAVASQQAANAQAAATKQATAQAAKKSLWDLQLAARDAKARAAAELITHNQANADIKKAIPVTAQNQANNYLSALTTAALGSGAGYSTAGGSLVSGNDSAFSATGAGGAVSGDSGTDTAGSADTSILDKYKYYIGGTALVLLFAAMRK